MNQNRESHTSHARTSGGASHRFVRIATDSGQGTDERQTFRDSHTLQENPANQILLWALALVPTAIQDDLCVSRPFLSPLIFFSPPLPLYPLFSFSWGGCPWAALTIVASRPPKGPPPPSSLSPLERSPHPPSPPPHPASSHPGDEASEFQPAGPCFPVQRCPPPPSAFPLCR